MILCIMTQIPESMGIIQQSGERLEINFNLIQGKFN